MLRMTRLAETASMITLNLEGRVLDDWVRVVERECRSVLHPGRKVVLDLSGVTYIDGRGVGMLKSLMAGHVEIINCPPVIEELLKGGCAK